MADPSEAEVVTETAQAPPTTPPPFIQPSLQKQQPAVVDHNAPQFVQPSVARKTPLPPGGGLVPDTYTVSDVEVPTKGALGPGYEDHPTLADLPVDRISGAGTKAALTFGPAMTETVEGRTNVLKNNLPGATFENDQYGNPLVVYEGKKYHINRPDSFNKQDVGNAIFQAVPTAALTAATMAVPGAGWVLGAIELASAGYLGNQFRAEMGRVAGSEEKRDWTSGSSLIEGALNAIIPGAFKAASTLTKEVGPGVRRVLPVKEAVDEALTKAHPHDRVYHLHPENAASLVRELPYTKVAEQVGADAAAHAKAAPTRIAQGLDDAVGPADANIKNIIATAKGPANEELTAALAQAQPINIAPLITSIDAEIAASAANSARAKALTKLKTMLTEQKGTAGTAGSREPVMVNGRPAYYRDVPGQAGSDPVYVTDARKLNDLKREFDTLLNIGSDADGIPRGSISPADNGISNVRRNLSGILNDSVPNYEALMGRYQMAYQMDDAYTLGNKIMTGGKGAVSLDDAMPYLQGDPQTAEAFKIGVRDAIDAAIRTAAQDKDAGAIKKILSGDNSYRREVLETLYGKEKIEALKQMAEREGNYAVINQMMSNAVDEGKALSSIARAGRLHHPIVGTIQPYQTAWGTALNVGSRALNKAGDFFAGAQGKTFEANLAKTLTGPARETLEQIRNSATAPIKNIAQTTGAAVPVALSERHTPTTRDTTKLTRAAGGRTTFKLDHAHKASKLCREAEEICKRHRGVTKSILNVPDAVVADALRVASRGR